LVQLFVGCIGSQVDSDLIACALRLLTALGYAVEIPQSQACCGALHRHNGFPETAERLCTANQRQLEKSRAESLITLASACHLELSEHLQSRLPVIGLTDFLLGLPAETLSRLRPLKQRVALHLPCTSRHDRSRALLEHIPGIDLVELPDNAICCGAAGSYLLTQPQLSTRLGDDKIERLLQTQAKILLTSNTGCALQFRQLIEQAGVDVEVMHPVELIARQLANG
jgi:glycolate oxidase iron-sulfur subunit